VTQDFGRLLPGETSRRTGRASRATTGRRATPPISSPSQRTRWRDVVAPSDDDLYGSFAGRAVRSVVLVCHPTAAADPRPDYALPTGRFVPHMQRGAEGPPVARRDDALPVLLFAHGFGGSPISNDYIAAVSVFASYGYVVAAPFHGDSGSRTSRSTTSATCSRS